MTTRCDISQLATMCGVKERTVEKWIQYRRITKPGTDGRWTAEEAHEILDWWIKRRKTEGPKKPNRRRQIF